MTTSARTTVLLTAMAAAAVACSSPPTPAPAPPAAPIEAPSVESQAGDAALTTYNAFWDVSQRALAAPGSKDWAPELEAVASGQALDAISTDVKNYADFPAHNEGTVDRTPTVQTSTDRSASIVDCVDMSHFLLIADRTRKVLTDTANQVSRFQFHAQLIRDETGRWLVDQTKPAWDEPC